jgi:hypothetical protein
VHVHSAHAVLTVWAAATARRIDPDVRIVFTPHYHGTGHSAVRRLLWITWRRYVAHAIEVANVIHAVSPREAGSLRATVHLQGCRFQILLHRVTVRLRLISIIYEDFHSYTNI